MNICQYSDSDDDFFFRRFDRKVNSDYHVVLYRLDQRKPMSVKVNDYYDEEDFRKHCNIIKDSEW